MTKPQIIQQLEAGFLNTTHTFQQTSEEKFYDKPTSGKWTVAENLVHLIQAVKPLNQAFLLPTFAFRLLFGKPTRQSRTYAELVAKYHKKLAEGGKASGRFLPKVAHRGQRYFPFLSYTLGEKRCLFQVCKSPLQQTNLIFPSINNLQPPLPFFHRQRRYIYQY